MGEAKRRRAMAQHMANSFPDDIKRDIAKTVRSIEWLLPDRRPAGMCFFRTMFGTITLNRLDIPAKPALGGMIYRAGPDEERDVVAFCGPGQCRDADRVELSRPLVHHVRRRHRRFFGRRLEGANGAGHVAGCIACRRDSARLNSMDRRPTRRNVERRTSRARFPATKISGYTRLAEPSANRSTALFSLRWPEWPARDHPPGGFQFFA